MRNTQGVTLIELLVTLSVAAILLGIAVPSLRDFLVTNRLSSASTELVGALSMARSEAIKRVTTVTVCKSANGVACTTAGGWDQGWIVFVDGNTQGTIDGVGAAADTPLRVGSPRSGLSISGGANFPNWISYRSTGFSNGAALNNGTFSICIGTEGLDVVVSSTGRARIADDDTDGTSC